MNRLDTLKAAAECVCGSREEDYGSPEDNFAVIAALWTAYTGTDITPKDVAMMIALLKIARAKAGSKPDTYVDLAGYAACGAEISAREPKRTAKRKDTTSVAVGGTGAKKTASCVKLQRMDGYYLVDVDGSPHRFTLWETAMQFIREHAGELT
jgi:hypothetical protein